MVISQALLEKERKYDHMFMDIASRVACMSYATRNKVGSVITKDGNIISFGWNGTPNGFDNSCEIDGVTKDEVIHAEMNAISKLAKTSGDGENSTMYVTLSPCSFCARLIIQTGITRVVYRDAYRDSIGLDLLRKANIIVDQLKEE
jgi:dCMP deaminase